MDAERDRRLIEAGEPPWGEVLPGTDDVKYFDVNLGPGNLLLRTVAREGAFYLDRYAGKGRWIVDSEPMTYLMSVPGEEMQAKRVSGREAAQLIAVLDEAASSGQDSAVD